MLDENISAFIWQTEEPRTQQMLLLSPKKWDSLGLPNLKLCYWAAKLHGIVEWVAQDEELRMSIYSFKKDAICGKEKNWSNLKIKNEWIARTRRV